MGKALTERQGLVISQLVSAEVGSAVEGVGSRLAEAGWSGLSTRDLVGYFNKRCGHERVGWSELSGMCEGVVRLEWVGQPSARVGGHDGTRGMGSCLPTSPESQSQMLSTCRAFWGGFLRCGRGATSRLRCCRSPMVLSAMASCFSSACNVPKQGVLSQTSLRPALYPLPRKTGHEVCTKTVSRAAKEERPMWGA